MWLFGIDFLLPFSRETMPELLGVNVVNIVEDVVAIE
jgi:hypothetical protein